jgi:hypothetical protein
MGAPEMKFHHRATDVNNDEIGDLIRQEDDPKNRAFLIILQNINLSLIANTQTINDMDAQLRKHLSEFSKHTQQDAELLNKGRGAWRVLSSVLVAVQMILGWMILETYTEIKSLHAADTVIERRLSLLEVEPKE